MSSMCWWSPLRFGAHEWRLNRVIWPMVSWLCLVELASWTFEVANQSHAWFLSRMTPGKHRGIYRINIFMDTKEGPYSIYMKWLASCVCRYRLGCLLLMLTHGEIGLLTCWQEPLTMGILVICCSSSLCFKDLIEANHPIHRSALEKWAYQASWLFQ